MSLPKVAGTIRKGDKLVYKTWDRSNYNDSHYHVLRVDGDTITVRQGVPGYEEVFYKDIFLEHGWVYWKRGDPPEKTGFGKFITKIEGRI